MDSKTNQYSYDAIGSVVPQTFSSKQDGSNDLGNAAIAGYDAVYCRGGCPNEYNQIPSSDIQAKFGFRF